MVSDFEKFSRLMLDAVHEMRDEFVAFRDDMSIFRDDMTNFRNDMMGFRSEVTQRLSGIERELADINRRLDALEDDVADIRGYAKEIDELRSRMRAIERHLGLEQKIAA